MLLIENDSIKNTSIDEFRAWKEEYLAREEDNP